MDLLVHDITKHLAGLFYSISAEYLHCFFKHKGNLTNDQ